MAVSRRNFLFIAALLLGGCVHPKVVAHRPPSLGWDGKANLALEQIAPGVKLKSSATKPDARPPMESLVLYAKARDAAVRGQSSAVIDDLQKAIALDPFRFQLRYDLGWAYVNANATDDSAIAAFEKAALLEPDHLELQTELGRLYLAKSNLPAAVEHLRLATQTSDYSTR